MRAPNSGTTVISASTANSYDVVVFYKLVQVACGSSDSPQSKGFNGGSSSASQQRKNLKSSTPKWDNIRRWFREHASRETRHTACLQQGMSNTAALHLLCKCKAVPIDIIQKVIDSAPQVLAWEDTNGWLPLHYACAHGASIEVLNVLLDGYPESESFCDHRKRTPLHFAFYQNEEQQQEYNSNKSAILSTEDRRITPSDDDGIDYKTEVVMLLKGAVDMVDERHRLPLHFAAAYGCTISALEALVDCYPDSIYSKEESGCTPLHYVMANAHNETSPSILKFLLNEMDELGINALDDNGNSPLQLLCIRATSIDARSSVTDDKYTRQHITECLKVYLSAKPKSSADFLTTIQSFPQWLRDEAVIHPHVKEILNGKISNIFPTSALILDGYFYFLIIICFSVATKVHIKYSINLEKEIPPNTSSFVLVCLIGASYFLTREVSQIISTISLGTFRAWILNPDNWLDNVVVVLLYYYCFEMREREVNVTMKQDFSTDADKQFQIGVTITIGILWTATVSYLKSCSLEFSLFFETVLYVTRKMFVYLIVLV